MSSIKLLFEIGHSAERKAKPSKHGFTHDWELFVKCPNDGNDISQYVEKVVFNLHDSFPKPKRVIKEPPYVVKESGYAGFELNIEIYLRNRDEPKKLLYSYDLDLQPFKNEIKEQIVPNPSDDFKRKCLKGGCQLINSDYKSSKDYKTSGSSNSTQIQPGPIKKPKRPDDIKTKSCFTELFGDPIEKSSVTKVMPVTKKEEKQPPQPQQPSSSSSHKDKDKSSKHKHSPVVDGLSKKTSSNVDRVSNDKPKKDKSRDRERSDKKDKSRSSQSAVPPVMPKEYPKPAIEQPTSSSTKKSSKKKSSDKDREKKESSSSKKSLDVAGKFESREKNVKQKAEVKQPPETKKQHDSAETERKHKHKKKEKTKEKEKKEKSVKAPTKPVKVDTSESDGDVEEFKQHVEVERHHGKSVKEKPTKSSEKEDKKRKRAAEKDERDSSASPPPSKTNKKEQSPNFGSKNAVNNNNSSSKGSENAQELKVSNEYLDELKDLKQKITTLKNNDHLQHVVRLIASTGCYEITKSTFDFDLVQLDKNTVQRLQEFFAT